MTERLLQYIWQFRYYNSNALQTVEGRQLQVVQQGQFHHNQGPDFIDARIRIDETTWAGNVELHIRSSDWYRHQHQADLNFNNTILHVVWEHDADVQHPDGSNIPTIELQHRVPKILLQHYASLMEKPSFVPCDNFLPAVNDLKWSIWKDRLTVERMQRKSAAVLKHLNNSKNHWEEVFWWVLARNFGSKVNAEFFEAVAKSLPIAILAKHKNQIHQLESLLFGQAGLLNHEFTGDYPKLLQREYRFLQKKYQLKQAEVQPQFLRMRPANFPTIRLAQLAMLIFHSSHLFSTILETKSITSLKILLNVTANDYWHYHYLFDESGSYKPKQTGNQVINNIIINSIVPVVFAYGLFHKNELYKEKALLWLSQVSAEDNNITKQWKAKGVENANAADSQALLELKTFYCNQHRCLECAIGNNILRVKEDRLAQPQALAGE